MALTVGTRLGPYEILAPLGAGGMGEVYKARDTRLDRTVAIKILPHALAADPQFRERFDREARAVSSLEHPNICPLYDVGEAAGTAFLVMQFLEGDTLATKRGLPVGEAVEIGRQVALGLEAAHERGIVHRDLKPANVFVTRDGTAKILDFGLAKESGGSGRPGGPGGLEALSMSPTVVGGTLAGVILGTAAYMSPEQARGLPVDKRADIWAFGCVLYEMVTGRQAFHGQTVTDIIAAIVTRDPDWTLLPPDVPTNVRRLVRRCLQKDPKQRLHDIADARIELSDAAVPETPAAAPHASRSPTTWSAAIVAVVALALGVGGGRMWQARRTAPTERWIGTRLGGPALVHVPRVSPDGQLVAFITLVDGQAQIAVMKPASGNWTLLTRDRSHGLTDGLAWSRDGTRIYYDRWTDGPQGVYSVPALGGEERLVLEDAGNPSVMPDGTLTVVRVNASRNLQYFRFSPATGRVGPLPAICTLVETPMVSLVNGRETVFFGHPTTGGDGDGLYRLDLASGHSQRIAREIEFNPSGLSTSRLPLAVSADGILVGSREGDAFPLFRLSSDGTAAKPVLSFPATAAPDIARDGSIYLSLLERPVEIAWVDPRGGPPRSIAPSPMFVYGGLAPLPDGRVMATSFVAGRYRVLTVAAGREPTPFLETDEETNAPMTAIGRDLAAVTIGSGPAKEVAIAAVTSGRVVRRLKGRVATATTLAASLDGKTLYYSASGSIWAMPADGGDERKISAGDSVTVDDESGDLIVKLDEQRARLVRVSPATGSTTDIPMRSELRMAGRPLSPGAVKNGRLLFSAASNDSWYWFVGVVDLKTGVVSKIPIAYETDFHLAAWSPDDQIVTMALGARSTLWRYQRASAR